MWLFGSSSSSSSDDGDDDEEGRHMERGASAGRTMVGLGEAWSCSGWRFASATTSCSFARQWRSEKRESLPPDMRATTLCLVGMLGGF